MSEVLITITTSTGAHLDRRAEILDEDRVLAVHNSVGHAPMWTLTHLPTGLALALTSEKQDAVAIGQALLGMKLGAGWRSAASAVVVDALPERVRTWLRACDAAHGFVPLRKPSRRKRAAQGEGEKDGDQATERHA